MEYKDMLPTLQQKVESWLDGENIKFEPSKLYGSTYHILDSNVYISLNDFARNNPTFNPFGEVKIKKNYFYDNWKQYCADGLRLVQFWENEVLSEVQFPVLQSIIRNAAGINQDKIPARKCELDVVPAKSVKEFIAKSNPQGYRNANEAIVLSYKGEPVFTYAIGHCFLGGKSKVTGNKKYDREVARGTCKLNTSVVGGASKVWKYLTEIYLPERDYHNIVYYCDNNYFKSTSFSNLKGLNFMTSTISFKNYWVEENKVLNREPARHSLIMEKMREGKIWAIFNAGTETYCWGTPNP